MLLRASVRSPFLFFVVFLGSYLAGVAQPPIGGTSSYDFLALSPSARVTALGGTNITIMDHDPSVQLSNPAALNPLMDHSLSAGTTVYPGNINFGNVSWVQRFKVPGTFGFGLQYIDYGKFTETDDAANIEGTFRAEEFNFYSGYGYQFGRFFSAGVNAKFIYSQMAFWNSEGMAADLSGMFNDTARLLTVTVAAKNMGGQFKPYTAGSYQPLPFDLQAGLKVGLKHTPFSFHLTLHHLYEWNIRYDDPTVAQEDLLLDSSSTNKKYVVDNMFRHVIIGTEINIKKVVRIDIAYNHLRQQELSLSTKRSIPGLSCGVGLHIRQFDFSYGIQPMGPGGALNYFTLSVNTAGFTRNRKLPRDVDSR